MHRWRRDLAHKRLLPEQNRLVALAAARTLAAAQEADRKLAAAAVRILAEPVRTAGHIRQAAAAAALGESDRRSLGYHHIHRNRQHRHHRLAAPKGKNACQSHLSVQRMRLIGFTYPHRCQSVARHDV